MRLQVLSGALALVGSSVAFKDSSPWVLLSTAPFDITAPGQAISLTTDVLRDTKDLLKECPTSNYLLVNQRGMTTADLRRATSDSSVLPSLSRAAADARVKGKLVVPEVIGQIKDMHTIEDTGLPDFIKSECTSREKKFDIDILDLASLPSEDQEDALARNNALIQDRITSATADDSFTILLLSTPNEPSYEPEFAEPIHVEHKRHLQASNVRRSDNDTEWEKLPLFEKYQFFTPGIFMGLIISLVLVSILGVGIKALGSLEVSYGSFEKDMGPAAQKKQQ